MIIEAYLMMVALNPCQRIPAFDHLGVVLVDGFFSFML